MDRARAHGSPPSRAHHLSLYPPNAISKGKSERGRTNDHVRFERASAENHNILLRSPLSTLPLPPRPRRLLRHDLRIDLLLRENSESSASRFRHTRGDYSVRLERRQRRDSRSAHGSPSRRRLTVVRIRLVVESEKPRRRGDLFLPSELLVEGAGYLLVACQLFIVLRRYDGHGDRLLLLC